jgi:hypothetical protein
MAAAGFSSGPTTSCPLSTSPVLRLYKAKRVLLSQNAGNLSLVAKPFFGVLSDAIYIGCAHRLPYITIGGMSATISSFLSCLSFCFSLIGVHAWAIL